MSFLSSAGELSRSPCDYRRIQITGDRGSRRIRVVQFDLGTAREDRRIVRSTTKRASGLVPSTTETSREIALDARIAIPVCSRSHIVAHLCSPSVIVFRVQHDETQRSGDRRLIAGTGGSPRLFRASSCTRTHFNPLISRLTDSPGVAPVNSSIAETRRSEECNTAKGCAMRIARPRLKSPSASAKRTTSIGYCSRIRLDNSIRDEKLRSSFEA